MKSSFKPSFGVMCGLSLKVIFSLYPVFFLHTQKATFLSSNLNWNHKFCQLIINFQLVFLDNKVDLFFSLSFFIDLDCLFVHIFNNVFHK